MAHTHNIIDIDNKFYINPITRAVKNNTGKATLAQNDHNSERFTFEIPRYVDGHDMALCDKVEVHFVNCSTEAETCDGVYKASDVKVNPASNDMVIFSWLIAEDATKYAGTLQFLISFVCLDGEKVSYRWNTAVFKGINVVAGM